MAFLELEGIRKEFAGTVAVENFDLRAEKGEFVSFLGPSGCGKTTTLRMIAGFELPTAGSIRIDGNDPNLDLAMLAQPAAILDYGARGKLVDVNSFMTGTKLADEHPATVGLYTDAAGATWGVPYKVDVKSTVWYPIKAFEAAGFTDVQTVLGSGNVVFGARGGSIAALQAKAEAAMQERLGHAFLSIVRPVDGLKELLASDPYRSFRLSPQAKRIVTFLRDAPPKELKLPIEFEKARILAMKGSEVFSVYLPNPKGPVFMALLERTSEVLGMWVPTTDLEIAAAAYERQVSELVQEDEETSDYVSQLEERVDSDEEDDSGGAARSLVEEVERYLRDRKN